MSTSEPTAREQVRISSRLSRECPSRASMKLSTGEPLGLIAKR
jgi:hypothetical protein